MKPATAQAKAPETKLTKEQFITKAITNLRDLAKGYKVANFVHGPRWDE